MTRFGDFSPLCSKTPSYPWCNLFYRLILKQAPSIFRGASANSLSAPVGINPECGIPRVGTNGSPANIANILACALSMILVVVLILSAIKRKAAVGHVEFGVFLAVYFFSLAFQLISTGSLLAQGSTALVVITAIHAGTVAALFWTLFANALVAIQLVDDGTPASVLPFCFVAVALFTLTTYISLDVALSLTATFAPHGPLETLNSIPLFVLMIVWPAAAAFLYFAIMASVALGVLAVGRPMWYYIFAAILFVIAQLVFFFLSKFICKASAAKVDGSFVATVLETASVCLVFLGWKSITNDYWDDYAY